MKAATLAVGVQYFQPNVFQSTPPVKAATKKVFEKMQKVLFQSTPPVKAATKAGLDEGYFVSISIHAAREGGDALMCVSTLF